LVSLSEIFLQNSGVKPDSSNTSSGSPHFVAEHKEKKKKAEKDPNAPKRNLSSYMLYSQAVRQDTVAQHPALKAVDIAKLIGEKWNALSDKEKLPYVKQAEKEKARFDKETVQYKATLGGEEHDTTPTKRKAVEEPSSVKVEASSSSSSKKKPKKNKESAAPVTEEKPTESSSSSSKKKKSEKKSSK
jgi:hypothetical protein